jgi:hypothetical protein
MLADGLRDWLRGKKTLSAEAAGLNAAELFVLAACSLVEGGKWQ